MAVTMHVKVRGWYQVLSSIFVCLVFEAELLTEPRSCCFSWIDWLASTGYACYPWLSPTRVLGLEGTTLCTGVRGHHHPQFFCGCWESPLCSQAYVTGILSPEPPPQPLFPFKILLFGSNKSRMSCVHHFLSYLIYNISPILLMNLCTLFPTVLNFVSLVLLDSRDRRTLVSQWDSFFIK